MCAHLSKEVQCLWGWELLWCSCRENGVGGASQQGGPHRAAR